MRPQNPSLTVAIRKMSLSFLASWRVRTEGCGTTAKKGRERAKWGRDIRISSPLPSEKPSPPLLNGPHCTADLPLLSLAPIERMHEIRSYLNIWIVLEGVCVCVCVCCCFSLIRTFSRLVFCSRKNAIVWPRGKGPPKHRGGRGEKKPTSRRAIWMVV